MPPATTQKVQITTEFIQKGAAAANRMAVRFNKNINAQQHSISNLNKKAKITADNTRMNTLSQKGLFGVMRLGQSDFKKFNEQGRHFANTGGRIANRARMATVGLRGFRMEMLGVMFFGMAMQRVFTGLLKTSLAWVGVNEILTTALGILFLPVAMMVLDWAIQFLDWVGKLTEGQKKMIGIVVLAGAAFGGFLFIVGTLFLGIGSMILVFGSLFVPIMLVVGAIAALAALVIGGSLFGEMQKDAEGLETSMMGLDFESISEALETGINKAVAYLVENVPIWLEKGTKLAGALLSGIAANDDAIKETIVEVIGIMADAIDENMPAILAIGGAIGAGILRGLANWIRDHIGAIIGGVLGFAIGGATGGPVGAAQGIVLGAYAGGELQKKFTGTHFDIY